MCVKGKSRVRYRRTRKRKIAASAIPSPKPAHTHTHIHTHMYTHMYTRMDTHNRRESVRGTHGRPVSCRPAGHALAAPVDARPAVPSCTPPAAARAHTQVLVDAKADLEHADEDGWTALEHAAGEKDNEKTVQVRTEDR